MQGAIASATRRFRAWNLSSIGTIMARPERHRTIDVLHNYRPWREPAPRKKFPPFE
jgi:hypothetical protein